MIETIQWNTSSPLTQKPVLRMVENERMAGSVPVWGQAITPSQKVEQTLSSVQAFDPTQNFGSAYQNTHNIEFSEVFSFGDLIDMVNPLHHIPLVNMAYQEITGDTIKPIGRIIGGGVFGGVAGILAGIVNMVVEEETGQDIGKNALSFMMDGKKPTMKAHVAKTQSPAHTRWDNPADPDMALALLSFSDLSQNSSVKAKSQTRPSYNS